MKSLRELELKYRVYARQMTDTALHLEEMGQQLGELFGQRLLGIAFLDRDYVKTQYPEAASEKNLLVVQWPILGGQVSCLVVHELVARIEINNTDSDTVDEIMTLLETKFGGQKFASVRVIDTYWTDVGVW